MKKKIYSRGQIESMLSSGALKPEDYIDHSNQHVRRAAWRLLGRPMPKTSEEREVLAKKLYPNHMARLAVNPKTHLPTTLKGLLQAAEEATP